MSDKTKSILKRFLKGFISGAVVSMAGVSLVQPTVWSEFISLTNSLLLAGVYGGGVGLLMAVQKWASWKE